MSTLKDLTTRHVVPCLGTDLEQGYTAWLEMSDGSYAPIRTGAACPVIYSRRDARFASQLECERQVSR